MNISIIQTELYWEEKEKNITHFHQKIDEIVKTDLIILPEMFTTGFSMMPEKLAEEMTGPSIQWMKKMSQSKKSALAGSLIIKENDNYFNRFVFVFPDGSLSYYDKRHLFSYAKEDKHFTGGNEVKIIQYLGWKICLQVCYDLRFPVWSRNVHDYDLLIYTANWPERRNYAWETLLKARAIENMAFVVGANRIGTDGMGIPYSGPSLIIDPLGEVICKSTEEEILCTTLNINHVHDSRKKFGFLNDRDKFQIL